MKYLRSVNVMVQKAYKLNWVELLTAPWFERKAEGGSSVLGRTWLEGFQTSALVARTVVQWLMDPVQGDLHQKDILFSKGALKRGNA